MPARHHVLAIVLFWAATICWLLYRDVWPRWRSSEAPPFVIDLAFEAQRESSQTAWKILRGTQHETEKPLGFVHTWVVYRSKDDTFELHSEIQQIDLGWIGPIRIRALRPRPPGTSEEPKAITGMYRVTREGELRENQAVAAIDIKGSGIARALQISAEVRIGGNVEGSRFVPQGFLTLSGHTEAIPLEPVEFNSRTSILNPLHPVSRISGLRRGRHWQLHQVDPLADSLAALLQKDPALKILLPNHPRDQILQAEVLPDMEVLTYEKQEAPCFVIEYRGDDLTAHTWVRQSDGKVLRQEATYWGERLILERL